MTYLLTLTSIFLALFAFDKAYLSQRWIAHGGTRISLLMSIGFLMVAALPYLGITPISLRTMEPLKKPGEAAVVFATISFVYFLISFFASRNKSNYK